MRSALVVLALTVTSSVAPATLRAERLEQVFVGSELRVRPSVGLFEVPRYELTLPHGLSSAHADLLARVGVVIAEHAGDLAFPVSLGVRYAPFDSRLRPLLGIDFGGYFSQSHGPRAQGAPSGLAWTWSTRALVGGELRLGEHCAARFYLDAAWAQTPGAVASRDYVFSGLGAGAELVVRWPPPAWRLVKMVLRGDDAPKGW